MTSKDKQDVIAVCNILADKMSDSGKVAVQQIIGAVEDMVENEPCEDCISRAEALRHSHIEYDDDGEGHRVVYVEDIEELPSVTPKGVTITDFADRCRECGKQKVGKWEELGIVMEGRMYEHGECDMQDAWGCDYCGYQVYMPTNYCPNCGAKMEVEDENKTK